MKLSSFEKETYHKVDFQRMKVDNERTLTRTAAFLA